MSEPYFMTRIDVAPGRILIEVEVLERRPPAVSDEQVERLRARLQDALEPVLAELWPQGEDS
jgi:hypothetical protein